jgi:hypothetical protein
MPNRSFTYVIEKVTADGSRYRVCEFSSRNQLTEQEAGERAASYVSERTAVIISDMSCSWGSPKGGRAPGVALYLKDDRDYFADLVDGAPIW